MESSNMARLWQQISKIQTHKSGSASSNEIRLELSCLAHLSKGSPVLTSSRLKKPRINSKLKLSRPSQTTFPWFNTAVPSPAAHAGTGGSWKGQDTNWFAQDTDWFAPQGAGAALAVLFMTNAPVLQWEHLSKTIVCWNEHLPKSLLLKIFVLHSPVWRQHEQHGVQAQLSFKKEIKHFSTYICEDHQDQAFILFTYLHILYLEIKQQKKPAVASLFKIFSHYGVKLNTITGPSVNFS